MTKRSSISNGDNAKSIAPGEYRFVNISLTESEKNQGARWIETVNLDELLSFLLLSVGGYKISISHNEKGDVFISTLSCKQGENEGLLLTARGKSPMLALGRVLFIHAVLFDFGGWAEREANSDEW